MPRAPLIKSDIYPYHITNRSNNKEFFLIDLDLLWEVFCKKLVYLQKELNCKTHVFVLMSNHYHLIMSTPDRNIGEAMKYLHREVAREANALVRRENHFFGGRYKWCIISSEYYYWNAVKYVFRNPIKANLCSKVTDYDFSSLNRSYSGLKWHGDNIFNETVDMEWDLDWLNKAYDSNQSLSLSKALRRREFKLPQLRGGYAVSLDKINQSHKSYEER
ncbi:MAG: transposase [Bdellovibrionales bacterium]|nr:transposase [Bdellovibrionales bacterium]